MFLKNVPLSPILSQKKMKLFTDFVHSTPYRYSLLSRGYNLVKHVDDGVLPIMLKPDHSYTVLYIFIANEHFVNKIKTICGFLQFLADACTKKDLGVHYIRLFFDRTILLDNQGYVSEAIHNVLTRFPPYQTDPTSALSSLFHMLRLFEKTAFGLLLGDGQISLSTVMSLLDETHHEYRLYVTCHETTLDEYRRHQPFIFPKAVSNLEITVPDLSRTKRIEFVQHLCDVQHYRPTVPLYINVFTNDGMYLCLEPEDLKPKLTWYNSYLGHSVIEQVHVQRQLDVLRDPLLPIILTLCLPINCSRFRQFLPKDLVRLIAEKLLK